MGLFKIFNSSVASRLTFWVLVVITIIAGAAGLWQISVVKNIATQNAHWQANRSMETAIKVIDNHVSNVETAVNTAASYAYLFATDEKSANTLLERLIASDEDISAATLLYEADYFPKHGRYYAPTITRHPDNGTLEWEEIGGPENDFCYLETDSNWIYTNKLDEGYWCLPYMDSMSTERPMVTYSVPLHDAKGHIYAVLCADVALDWVKKIVEEAKPYESSEAIVLARDSQYVFHPNFQWVQSVNVLTYSRKENDTLYIKLLEKMLHGERGTDTLFSPMLASSDPDSPYKNSKSIVFYSPVNRVQWSVSFTIPEDLVMEQPNKLRNYMLFMLLGMLLLIAVVLYYAIHSQLRHIKLLSQSTGDIANGNFNVKLPVINTHDEVRLLRDSFEDMQVSLAKYVEELQQTTASKASIESELKVASDIQLSMIPKQFPPFPERDDVDIYGSLTPAKMVGGDLYDFHIRDEKLFFCVGDVSGKGVPASLVMAVTRALFRSISSRESQPDTIVSLINDTITTNNDSNMFVTLFVGVLDLPTGRLRYCNAAHNEPLLIPQVDFLPCDSNIPVGVMSGWKYTEQEVMVSPQSIIFLYTDGLTEAEDHIHAQFGENRLCESARKLVANGVNQPQPFVEGMAEDVHAFVGEAEQSDDLTMMAVIYSKEHLTTRYQNGITLSNNIEEVPQLADFVDEVCEAVGFDMATTMSINLAIEEAVVNVMNYAYPPGVKGNVIILAESNDTRVKFVIIDRGKPFDPTAKSEVDTTLPAEERQIGGLGIHLVRQIMDSINYERVEGQNILTLRKKLTSANGQAS